MDGVQVQSIVLVIVDGQAPDVNGWCSSPGICTCNSGWTGTRCTTGIYIPICGFTFYIKYYVPRLNLGIHGSCIF
jgi:hypothetical protein